MELAVRGDVAGAADGVREYAVLEGEDEGTFAAAGYHALWRRVLAGLLGGEGGNGEREEAEGMGGGEV